MGVFVNTMVLGEFVCVCVSGCVLSHFINLLRSLESKAGDRGAPFRAPKRRVFLFTRSEEDGFPVAFYKAYCTEINIRQSCLSFHLLSIGF